MNSISIRTGSEGPRHDPYHFIEITVHRPNGKKVTHHSGLAEWARVEWPDPSGLKSQTRILQVEHEPLARNTFTEHAGVTPERAEKAHHEVKSRRIRFHSCGTKHLREVNGYPGETLTVCGKCGKTLDAHFDLSAVI
jgi:hypothetical protein